MYRKCSACMHEWKLVSRVYFLFLRIYVASYVLYLSRHATVCVTTQIMAAWKTVQLNLFHMGRREKVVRKLYDFACSCYLTTSVFYSKLLIPTILTILFGTAKKSLACSLSVKVFFYDRQFSNYLKRAALRQSSPIHLFFPLPTLTCYWA